MKVDTLAEMEDMLTSMELGVNSIALSFGPKTEKVKQFYNCDC